jgi:Sensors of blue-light using FAD
MVKKGAPSPKPPVQGDLGRASAEASDGHSEYLSTQPATLPTPISESPSDSLPASKSSQTQQPLAQMLICSMVVGKPTPEQLQALEALSMQNNRNRGLTGVLLCGNGVFVHWLEGLDEYVQAAWKSIARDNRHENIVVLWQNRNAPERLFGDWVMGLRSTIVAQDFLSMFQVIKKQQSAKTMLGLGCYEVFFDALRLLERVCMLDTAQQINGAALPLSGHAPALAHKTAGPARGLINTMQRTPFEPVPVMPEPAEANPDRYTELSSLNTDASSMFKNSVPMEHTALFDLAAQGYDDLLTMLDMPLRWALGKDLWERRVLLSDKPLHWNYDGKLVVVFDHKTWRVGLHPELTSVAYEQATMIERLRSANDIPAQFRQTTTYALFWDYAEQDARQASPAITLPKRLSKYRMRLRRQPPVPVHVLTQEQQRLMALFGDKPESLADLAQAMGMSTDAMVALLKPFYAARCIEAVGDDKSLR